MRKLALVLVIVLVGCSSLHDPAVRARRAAAVYVDGAAPASTLSPAETQSWNALGQELLHELDQLVEATK